MKIYLVRHGQTEWNKQKRYQGSKDIGLDNTGLDQAEKLAEKLKNIQWSKVYSSDLQRARKTAETVASKCNFE
ncbi:MAG: histidine phosphatase family protein, partial [Negativicutes bacterium]|nr:histidine phosphatase family protein [Negativicutes bacterium]